MTKNYLHYRHHNYNDVGVNNHHYNEDDTHRQCIYKHSKKTSVSNTFVTNSTSKVLRMNISFYKFLRVFLISSSF